MCVCVCVCVCGWVGGCGCGCVGMLYSCMDKVQAMTIPQPSLGLGFLCNILLLSLHHSSNVLCNLRIFNLCE